ncbi:hypothetical protein PSQ19_06105 [Devosia algicola]|uniref:Uncharacterized protein n=1 Tax=Devosia algicola TaxID=3026418 RepID=A0ABY7YQS6_9HYPH|nr:hypothetical protein [Devosia algicola]WDR03641.1 hypothetical protein PSQ19_06105 [Devosia algicola]
MSLAVRDIFRLETRVRFHAERLRRDWPESMLIDPAVSPEMKGHAQNERAKADDFDLIGDLLVGLQGDWEALRPLLLNARARLLAEHEEKSQAQDTAA